MKSFPGSVRLQAPFKNEGGRRWREMAILQGREEKTQPLCVLHRQRWKQKNQETLFSQENNRRGLRRLRLNQL